MNMLMWNWNKKSVGAIAAFLVMYFAGFATDAELNVFVSPSGNDQNSGKLGSPFRSISRAQMYVKKRRATGNYSRITVYLRGGTYVIDRPIVLSKKDGGAGRTKVAYQAYRKETPIISGGKVLPKKWIRVDKKSDYWKLSLANDNSEYEINQLFRGGRRLARSRSNVLYTTGPIRMFSSQIKGLQGYDFDGVNQLRKRTLLPFCSFAYSDSDLELDAEDLENAEIMLNHSWDCTWHRISKVDQVYNSVYLKSPSYYPVGFFSMKNRYVIENTRRYFRKPGDWFYDKKKGELWYLSKPGENPNTVQFVVPQLNQLLVVKGETLISPADKVQNITFTGLSFQYTVAPRGIHADKSVVEGRAGYEVPWLDLKTGFSGIQANVEVGQAVLLQNAANIVFDRCKFSKLGNYGMRIDKYSVKNNVLACEFSDLGAGGIIIGFDGNATKNGIPEAAAPAGNIVNGCRIHDGGLVYPTGVGIGIMNANTSTVSKNQIYNFGYSGISCGWTWGFGKSFTWGNAILNNNIHHVMRELADGGGIYTLGVQPKTIIRGNTIHDIAFSKDAVGSPNNGIFFDEGSSQIFVEGNTIYNIQHAHLRFNKTDESRIKMGKNALK